MKRISVIGAGYVGLVSGAGLAHVGHDVTCVDVDPARVAAIASGRPPFFEEGLPELLAGVLAAGRFRATTDLASAVRESDFTMLAVGTPFDGSRIDLSSVIAAAEEVGHALRTKTGRHVVIVKSTVVPGTTDQTVRTVLERASGRVVGPDLGLAMNPEFLSEGSAVEDFLRPDRIVVGAGDESTSREVAALYAAFGGVPVLAVNNTTAEMIKYASNAVLATLISFANELGNLCQTLGGVDMADVSRGVSLAGYFRPEGSTEPVPITAFLRAGCGFGGSCLPKDVRALVSHGRDAGEPMRLLSAVMEVNDDQPERVIALLQRHFRPLSGVEVAVLGLSFKPGTDDIRESPAVPVLRRLADEGAKVRAYDPLASGAMAARLPGLGLRFADSLDAAIDGAQAVVVLTAWDEFRRLPALARATDRPPVLVDGRRLIDRSSYGTYEGIGC